MKKQLAVSNGLKLRWINGQCFEFKFSNGKNLLTDPWYSWDDPNHPLAKICPPGFDTGKLEGADYVFLNHTHGDHIFNLQEVYDRFHSTVITHSAVAFELVKAFDIPLTSIYPVDYEGTYYFEGFSLCVHHETHHEQGDTLSESLERKRMDSRKNQLSSMGGLFNMNFELTTEEGLRIAFLGGNDDGMLERFKRNGRPNIVIRNKMHSSKHMENVSKDWAEFFAEANVQLLIPMHYETWVTNNPEFIDNVFWRNERYHGEKRPGRKSRSYGTRQMVCT